MSHKITLVLSYLIRMEVQDKMKITSEIVNPIGWKDNRMITSELLSKIQRTREKRRMIGAENLF